MKRLLVFLVCLILLTALVGLFIQEISREARIEEQLLERDFDVSSRKVFSAGDWLPGWLADRIHVEWITVYGVTASDTHTTSVRSEDFMESVELLQSLPDLQWLDLAGTDLTDQHVAGFAVLRQLSRVNISNTKYEGDITDLFAIAPNLTELYLRNTDVRVPQSIPPEAVASLTHLSIAECRGMGDAEVRVLVQGNSLVSVNVSDTRVGDEGVRAILQSPELESLCMNRTEITPRIVDLLIDSPSLQYVEIRGCEIPLQSVRCLAEFRPDVSLKH